jgi:Nif-specific regulatory protein
MNYSVHVPRPAERPAVRLPPGVRPLDLSPMPGPAKPTRRLSPEMALSGLYEISKIVTSPQRLEIILANTVSVLSAFLQMRRGLIVLVDATGEPEIIATGGGVADGSGPLRAQVPERAIDRIIATATPLVVHDMSEGGLFDKAHLDAGDSKVAFLGVPIRIDAKAVGTLSIDRARDGEWEFRFDEDIRFLTMVANLLAQVVKMHRLLAADRATLMSETERLQRQLTNAAPASAAASGGIGARGVESRRIIGDSEPMRALLRSIAVVAPTSTTVLLRGESGTGKELIAGAIHEGSKRATKPYVKLNCAALSETVLESELFGHEKGAFTNALATKQGRFEMADGGTLFLDEIGEISSNFQAKLLRVLQEGEFERVGGTKTLKVDVRLICATNRDLEAMVAAGTFRADLYYRISVLPIMVPALRERPGDIPRIAQALVQRFNKENGTKLGLSRGATDVLSKCYFPGNVRELENCVRRSATLSRGETLEATDLACISNRCLSSTLWKGASSPATTQPALRAVPGVSLPVAPPPSVSIPLFRDAEPAPTPYPPPAPAPAHAAAHECGCADADARAACRSADACAANGKLTERDRLIDAMEKTGWVQAKAARLLNITPRQIGYALRKHDIEMKKF